jgi:hypothetical protein
MTIRTTGQFDATAGLPLAGSVFDELAALASLQMSFEPNPLLGATITSSKVQQIISAKSFPANYLLQGTAGQRPGYVASSINGLPVADFDGTDDYLQFTSAIDLTAAHTWVIAFHVDSIATDEILLRGGASSGNEEYIFAKATGITTYALGNRSIDCPTLPGYNLLICASNGAGTLKMWANGIYRESASGGNNSVPSGGQPVVGAFNASVTPTLPMNGQIPWLAYFTSDVFASEPQALQLVQDHARYAYGLSF